MANVLSRPKIRAGEDHDREEHDDRVADDLFAARPCDLAQLGTDLADELAGGRALKWTGLGAGRGLAVRGAVGLPSAADLALALHHSLRLFDSPGFLRFTPYRGGSAGQEGLEPPTAGFGDRCSANLSYCPRLGGQGPITLAPGRYRAPSGPRGGLSWRRREPAAGPRRRAPARRQRRRRRWPPRCPRRRRPGDRRAARERHCVLRPASMPARTSFSVPGAGPSISVRRVCSPRRTGGTGPAQPGSGGRWPRGPGLVGAASSPRRRSRVVGDREAHRRDRPLAARS